MMLLEVQVRHLTIEHVVRFKKIQLKSIVSIPINTKLLTVETSKHKNNIEGFTFIKIQC
jgi:hypothetical protein